MENTQIFLTALSKIMDETAQKVMDPSYDDYYNFIYKEFLDELEETRYPKGPIIQKRLTAMLEEIEYLYLCPEVKYKTCILFKSRHMDDLFQLLGDLFLEQKTVNFYAKMRTEIPYLIFHTENEGIEVLNYANRRIPISKEEFQILLKLSSENKIALNKIIKHFIIKAPLKYKEQALLFDNLNEGLATQFSSSINKQYSFKTTSAININKVMKEVEKIKHPIYHGYEEELDRIAAEINNYYQTKIDNAESKLTDAKSDSVQQNTKSTLDKKILALLKRTNKKNIDRLEHEKLILDIELEELNGKLRPVIKKISNLDMNNVEVPKKVIDNLFISLFLESDEKNEEDIIKQLTKLKYNDMDLLFQYLGRFSDNRSTVVLKAIGKDEWEKAKMYIALSRKEQEDNPLIRNYLKILKGKIDTNKEYYLKSLYESGNEKISSLKMSYELGNRKAGWELFELYKQGVEGIDVQMFLSNLNVEACILEAQKIIAESDYPINNLEDDRLTYYKIAASQNSLKAIAYIVDTIFNSNFADAARLVVKSDNNSKVAKRIEMGEIIIYLCEYLINKQHKVKHYSEILGVVYFCLDKKMSTSFRLLNGIDTGVANFCKANMYRYGKGTTKNIKEALKHYEKAKSQGFNNSRLVRNIYDCRQALDKQKNSKEEQYSQKTEYKREKINETTSSGCIITTATCHALAKGDDCQELNLLRNFRDEWVERTSEGELLVREYYRVSQLILEKLSTAPNKDLIFKDLWMNYILPTCRSINSNDNESGEKIYIDMVLKLSKNFDVEITQGCKAILSNRGYL